MHLAGRLAPDLDPACPVPLKDMYPRTWGHSPTRPDTLLSIEEKLGSLLDLPLDNPPDPGPAAGQEIRGLVRRLKQRLLVS